MVSALISKYVAPIGIILVVALSLVSFTLYLKYEGKLKEIEKLNADIQSRDFQVNLLTANISTLELTRLNDQRASTVLATAYSDQRIENKRLNDELTKYEGRTKTVSARPTLVEHRINAAADRLFKSIECATGNCGTEGDTSISPATP